MKGYWGYILGSYTPIQNLYPQRSNAMRLTDVKVRNAKPKGKQYKLFDGDGLFLQVMPNGSKYWRYKYRFDKKEKTFALGVYPEISLLEARSSHLEARKALANDIDPAQQKKAQKQAQADITNSFEVVAREWYGKFLHTWTAAYAETILYRLETYAFPFIGEKPIIEVTAPDVLRVLRHIESNGALVTAHRMRGVISQVMRYAISSGYADRDPAADTKGSIPHAKEKHMAAITDPVQFGGLLQAIDGYQGSFSVKCALQLQALTFVRPGELRHAEWSEIDLDAAQWSIPGEKMKLKEPHIVPLSVQAVNILKELHPLTKRGRYVFPNGRTLERPMSENAVLAALRYLGFGKDEKTEIVIMTGHGFRAAARTMLDEVLQQRVDLIEHQLAHAVKDPNGRAYNRTAHLPARRVMMQLWADYLDGLKAGAKVLPLVKNKI